MPSAKCDRTHIDFPVPRGPNRKKLLLAGGFSNRVYMRPNLSEKWPQRVQIFSRCPLASHEGSAEGPVCKAAVPTCVVPGEARDFSGSPALGQSAIVLVQIHGTGERPS